MSLQNILLNTDTNQQGLYDAQLHSCQVYKTPVLPTDVLRKQDLATALPFIKQLFMPNLTPTLPPATVTTESVYTLEDVYGTGDTYSANDYICVGIGFSNNRDEDVRGFSPMTNNGLCAVSYHRSSELLNTLGTDNIWAWVIPKTSFSYIDPRFMAYVN